MFNNTIGKQLRKLRKEKQISQEELAERLNIRRQTVSAYERGVSTPDIYILMDISHIFEVSLDELTGNDKWSGGRKEGQRRKE